MIIRCTISVYHWYRYWKETLKESPKINLWSGRKPITGCFWRGGGPFLWTCPLPEFNIWKGSVFCVQDYSLHFLELATFVHVPVFDDVQKTHLRLGGAVGEACPFPWLRLPRDSCARESDKSLFLNSITTHTSASEKWFKGGKCMGKYISLNGSLPGGGQTVINIWLLSNS